jgi:Carboxypeptidase regulatory-like domain
MKRRVLLPLLFVFLCASYSFAQMEIIEVETPKPSKAVAGVVTGPTGAELEGVVVEERSGDWKTVIRSTTTDRTGRFRFASKSNQATYYLQFSFPGFNWLRIKVQLDKHGQRQIAVELPIAA